MNSAEYRSRLEAVAAIVVSGMYAKHGISCGTELVKDSVSVARELIKQIDAVEVEKEIKDAANERSLRLGNRIVEYLETRAPATRSQLISAIGGSRSDVLSALTSLERRGVVTRADDLDRFGDRRIRYAITGQKLMLGAAP